jgi:hypothetical protein
MTAICGWIPNDRRSEPARVVSAMTSALRVHDGQSCAIWTAPGPCSVGLLEPWPVRHLDRAYAPAISEDRRHHLWMAGESSARKPAINHSMPTRSRADSVAGRAELPSTRRRAVQHLGGVPIAWTPGTAG